MSTDVLDLWWIALAAGVVVILCVMVLLSLLGAFLRDVDVAVRGVHGQVRPTTEHLSYTPLLEESADRIAELGDELGRGVAAIKPLAGAGYGPDDEEGER